MVRGGVLRHIKKKSIKTYSRHNGRKSKKGQSSSSSLTFSGHETENTTLEGNSRSKLCDRYHGRWHCTKRYEDGLDVFSTAKARFQRDVDYRKCRIEIKLSNYDRSGSKNISKMSKGMKAEMEPHTFDPFDPISIIEFMCNFELAYDNNGIQEGAPM